MHLLAECRKGTREALLTYDYLILTEDQFSVGLSCVKNARRCLLGRYHLLYFATRKLEAH